MSCCGVYVSIDSYNLICVGFSIIVYFYLHCCTVHIVSSSSLLFQLLHFTTLFFLWRCDPTRVMASSFLRFLDHTQRRTTVGRTPLDEWSARRRDLYLTTNIHAPGGIRTHDLSRQAACGRSPAEILGSYLLFAGIISSPFSPR